MKVLKFGGSSLADAKRYQKVFDISSDVHASGGAAVVLSAPKGVTNALSLLCEQAQKGEDYSELFNKLDLTLNGIAEELRDNVELFDFEPLQQFIKSKLDTLSQQLKGISLLGSCPDQVAAGILSLGEYVSVNIFSKILSARKIPNKIIDPVGYIIAQGSYLDSLALLSESQARFSELQNSDKELLIMPGFVAVNELGEKVTLGRNGSDYSAAILAACISAEACEIWTDVDGVYNADPNQVEGAVLLDKLTYQEAMELSYFGAKVLHPKTIGPIAQFGIPCIIKNTLNPSAAGTKISHEPSAIWTSVKGISHLEDIVMFNVSGPGLKGMVGMASKIFDVISNAEISISLITQSSSEYSISFCIPEKDANKALDLLEESFALELSNQFLEPIEVRRDLAIVTLVGDGMRESKGMAAKFFDALAQARVNNVAIAQGSSERSISTVIENSKAKKAVKVIHQNFFSNSQSLDVFLIGCGTVGQELLRQINEQKQLLSEKDILLRVYGIANSKLMLLEPNGVDLDSDWQSKLNASTKSFSIENVAEFVRGNSLTNPVIIDCTSSQLIADQYINMLEAGFHVVTPNKKANTANMQYYELLQKKSQQTRRQYLYETTVGAGLPVIDNLQKLVLAGDKLQTFEGILSGSLSFIFGKLEEGLSLSEATEIAKQNGFTEPDPRDDLSGMDVARKLLIMAREAGMALELEDIQIESVLDENFDATGSIDEFMQNLSQLDDRINTQVKNAEQQGKVLRYVGSIADGRCQVKITEVDQQHPLAAVKDGENALAIHSIYYSPKPFVIRGYGAGATVTAAGVFSDLLRTLQNQMEYR